MPRSFRFPDFSPGLRAWGTALVLGAAGTAGLFVAGFLPSAADAPAMRDLRPGERHALTQPETRDATREIVHAAAPAPVEMVRPDIELSDDVAVEADAPDLRPDFKVNPRIDIGMTVPALPQTASPAIAAEPAVFALSELDVEPALLFSPRPAYPSEARRSRTEGEVIVRLVIDPQGRVLRAAAMPGPDNEVFAAATLRAVRSWRFRPAEKDGREVMCWVEIPVRFRLGALQ